MSPRLRALLVGQPRNLTAPDGTTFRSAIAKEAVAHPLWLGREGLAGDGVASRKHHGGPEKAVLCYADAFEALWAAELGLSLPPGALGENLRVEGLSDHDVCIGDTFDLGEARIQVSEPRQPCATLARRWGVPDLVARIWANGRSGWYCRVLQEGHLQAGQPVVRVDRPHPGWTTARVLQALRDGGAEARAASALTHLSEGWRQKLAERG